MRGRGGEIRIAQTAEDMKISVGRRFLVKKLMRYGEIYRLGGAKINKVSGSGKSFGPVGGWHASLD